jgi:hypothetical protein
MAVEMASDKQDRFVEHVVIPRGFPKRSGEGNLVRSHFLHSGTIRLELGESGCKKEVWHCFVVTGC